MNTILDKYLFELFSSIFKQTPEKEEIKRIRTTKSFIWLYHGSPIKNHPLIKKYGLDPSRMGQHTDWFGKAKSPHSSGKDAISYSSNKSHSFVYSGIFKSTWPLLVKVPTKNLEVFEGGFLDELISIDPIPQKNIIFPEKNKSLYIKIEKENKYLDTRLDKSALSTPPPELKEYD